MMHNDITSVRVYENVLLCIKPTRVARDQVATCMYVLVARYALLFIHQAHKLWRETKPSLRTCVTYVCHNGLRDFTANLLTEVCSNVCIEPSLQSLTGELLSHETSNSQDGGHLDVSAQGFGVIVTNGHF